MSACACKWLIMQKFSTAGNSTHKRLEYRQKKEVIADAGSYMEKKN